MIASRMTALYRMTPRLPSLAAILLLAACEQAPAPARPDTAAIPNAYLEALQDAEALRATAQDRQAQEKRIDELLGGTAQPRQ